MATVYAPIAKDSSIKTTESPSRNIADVLAQELSGIANAITGGADKAPKTDIATVEPSNTASRAYSVGELVYVNGNLYKVITAISIGATFTVGTNIQSTNVSERIKSNDNPVEIREVTVSNFAYAANDYNNMSAYKPNDTTRTWYLMAARTNNASVQIAGIQSSYAVLLIVTIGSPPATVPIVLTWIGIR